MRLPKVHGVIQRRLLVNFRVDPEVIAPLAIDRVHSSYFADAGRFPPGSATFDCALVMRNIAHEWHEGASLKL
jgi:hypothetical protein